MLRGNPLPGGSSAQLVRSELLRAVGGFDHAFPILGDWDLWIRLAGLARFAAASEPLVAYRRHSLNQVTANLAAHLREFDALVIKHEAEARGRELCIDGVGFYNWLADAQRREGRRWRATYVHLVAAWKFRSFAHLASGLRSPLGSWAVGLRSPERQPAVAAPLWLQRLRGSLEPAPRGSWP
jgi:hypothetical protein